MKIKLIAIIVLAGVLAIGLVRTLSKSYLQKQVPKENQIQWHIQEAKNQGRKKVSVATPTADYLGSAEQDVNKALSEYTVIVAEPIESRTFQHTPNTLITWYKFKTIESLSDTRLPGCFECNSLSAPREMLPILAGEFLVPRQGGTIEREGVEFTQADHSFPPFKQDQRYLMLISLYPSGVALTAGGPVGVFLMDKDEKLLPLSEEPPGSKKALRATLRVR